MSVTSTARAVTPGRHAEALIAKAAATISLALAGVVTAGMAAAAQDPIPVQQGQTVLVGTLYFASFATVEPPTAGTQPVASVPGPNQFVYRVSNPGDNISVLLDNDSSVQMGTLPYAFTRSLNHHLSIGAGSTTGINSQFNATITLLATAA